MMEMGVPSPSSREPCSASAPAPVWSLPARRAASASAAGVPDGAGHGVEAENLLTEFIVDESFQAEVLDSEVARKLLEKAGAHGHLRGRGCYLAEVATLTGVVIPPLVKGDPETAAPELVNALTPEPDPGVGYPDLIVAVDGNAGGRAERAGGKAGGAGRTVPVGSSLVTELLPLLETQTLPELSTAMDEGALRPPPV